MNNPKEMGFFYENCYFSHFHNIPMKVMRNIVMANYFFLFQPSVCLELSQESHLIVGVRGQRDRLVEVLPRVI